MFRKLLPAAFEREGSWTTRASGRGDPNGATSFNTPYAFLAGRKLCRTKSPSNPSGSFALFFLATSVAL